MIYVELLLNNRPKNSPAANIELLVLSDCFGSRNGCLNQYNNHSLEERKTSLPLDLECDVSWYFICYLSDSLFLQ